MTDKSEASRFIQKIRLLVKVAVVFLAIGLVMHAMMTVSAKKGLDQCLADLKSRHEPLTFAEIAPKPVPEDQNGAQCYLDAYDVWVAACKATTLHNTSLGELLGTQNISRLKPEEVEPQARAIDAAVIYVKEAQKHPECVFPIDWNEGWDIWTEHGDKLKTISEILAAKAVIDARDHKLDKTMEDVILGLRLSDSLSAEPLMISFNIRNTCIKRTLTGLRVAMEEHHFTENQARAIYDELGMIDLQPHYKLAMQGVRISVNNLFDWIRRYGDVPYLSANMAITTHMPDMSMENKNTFQKGLAGISSYAWRPMSYRDQKIYHELLDKQVSMISLPYRELINRPTVQTPKYNFAANALLPPISAVTQQRDSVQASIGLAQASVAAMAYKDRFGSYPASLKDLKSRLGWNIPDDPFSGKPFIYKRDKSGFVIYSIGSDLKDDGGKLQPKSTKGNCDIVWKIKK